MPEIRKMQTDDDIRRTAELAAVIWREHFRGMITDGQIDYMLERFQSFDAMQRQRREEGYEYYGFFIDGVQQGYFAVAPRDGTLFLSKLYLCKEQRGKGYASEMFGYIKACAKERGLSSIWLTVNRHNDDSVAVYRHWGMEVIREQVADIGGGFVMDDYVFELKL